MSGDFGFSWCIILYFFFFLIGRARSYFLSLRGERKWRENVCFKKRRRRFDIYYSSFWCRCRTEKPRGEMATCLREDSSHDDIAMTKSKKKLSKAEGNEARFKSRNDSARCAFPSAVYYYFRFSWTLFKKKKFHFLLFLSFSFWPIYFPLV